MGRLLRAAARLIPATVLLLGCSSSPGGPSRRSPSATPPSTSEALHCLVADTTTPTVDTLYAIGAGPQEADTPDPSIDCGGHRRPGPPGAPVVVSMAPPPGTDLRDLLDERTVAAGVRRPDVLVTRDPDVLAYAGRRSDYVIAALPWHSTYLLVAAGSIPAANVLSPAERDALARDAVTADARGAVEPFAWRTDPACASAFPGLTSAPRPVVAYAAGDAIARQLAERIVALSGANPLPAWLAAVLGQPATAARVAPVPADSIPDALAVGRAAAAVLPLARDPRTSCGTRDNVRVPAGAIPLVDSRAHVIVRRGSGAALLVAPDGSLYVIRRGAR